MSNQFTQTTFNSTATDYTSLRATQLYNGIFMPHWVRTLLRFFGKAPQEMPVVELGQAAQSVAPSRHNNTVRVPVADVQGTVSAPRAQDFDADFRPLTDHSKSRWLSVAYAMLSNTSLPPVILVKVAGKYLVVDGHHRVSVAKALGRDDIRAIVAG